MVSLFFIFCIIFFFLIFLYYYKKNFNCISYPFQAIQATFKAEEMVNYSHRKMKEEEGRRIVVVDAFQVAEIKQQGLKG